MQPPTLAQTECSAEDDDQCLASHRTKAEPLTAVSSLRFMSSTSRDIDVKPSSSMNTEEIPSPSQSPTLVFDISAQNSKASRTPTPLPTESPMPEDAFISKSSTPPVATLAKTPRKGVSAPLQLIGDLPVARDEALASFSEIQDNNYQNKSLGRSRELLESMTCECTHEPGSSSVLPMSSFLVVSGLLLLIEALRLETRKFPSLVTHHTQSSLRMPCRFRQR
jgi:hypothetical protein